MDARKNEDTPMKVDVFIVMKYHMAVLYRLLVKGERGWGGDNVGTKIVSINFGTAYRFKINDQAIDTTIMNFTKIDLDLAVWSPKG